MFGYVPPTPYDVQFSLFGVPVRVHPIFWATSAILAWRPNELDMTLVGVLCIFVAIIVHEMGHALVTAHFGWRGEIVLYWLGGYATTTRHSTWRDIAVLAAGPGAGLLLFAVVWTAAVALGALYPDWNVLRLRFDSESMRAWPAPIAEGTRLNELICTGIFITLWINSIWTFFNLLPVFPLDGGQISRELFLRYGGRDGLTNSLRLSFAAGAAVALAALFWRDFNLLLFRDERSLFVAVMFGFFAFQSWQALQHPYGRGGW